MIRFLEAWGYTQSRTRRLSRRTIQYQLRQCEHYELLVLVSAAVGGNPAVYRFNFERLTALAQARQRPPRWHRPVVQPTATQGAQEGAQFLSLYVPTKEEDPAASKATPENGSLEVDHNPAEDESERPPVQRPASRAARPEVAAGSAGKSYRWGFGHIRQDSDSFEADVATLAMPGRFASPKVMQAIGFKVFDAHAGEPFHVMVAKLKERVYAEHIATSEAQCRHAMNDVWEQRAPNDRTTYRDRGREPR